MRSPNTAASLPVKVILPIARMTEMLKIDARGVVAAVFGDLILCIHTQTIACLDVAAAKLHIQCLQDRCSSIVVTVRKLPFNAFHSPRCRRSKCDFTIDLLGPPYAQKTVRILSPKTRLSVGLI